MFASPAICIPPWPPPPPYPPPSHCTCGTAAVWDPVTRRLTIGASACNTDNPAASPFKAWISTTPALTYANPLTGANCGFQVTTDTILPPGITSVTITIGFVFQNGYKCSAHITKPTP